MSAEVARLRAIHASAVMRGDLALAAEAELELLRRGHLVGDSVVEEAIDTAVETAVVKRGPRNPMVK